MKVITETPELAALCERLGSEPYITVDTEFLRDSTYYAKLCLIQVAGQDEAACIDPLAPDIDLTSFHALMQNAGVLKVFHAARQDLEIFFHATGQVPAPLFDSQVAAMVCGFGENIGYEHLVRELAKAKLDKSNRFTDWSRRPLSERQIKYALGDVTHLRVIYEKLSKRIARNQRGSWLEEEMQVLGDPETYRLEPEDAWQRLKLRSTEPLFVLTAQKLAAWRESEAQRRDMPRNRVLRDDVILELAAQRPHNQEELERVRGLGGNAKGKTGAALLTAIGEALDTPPEQRPKLVRKEPPNGQLNATIELLKVLLKRRCATHDVAAKMIASSADLEALAADPEAKHPVLHGWRREVFGDAALKLMDGKLALAIKNREIVEFEED